MQAGPSNAGLADPGQGAAIALTQITTALLVSRPSVQTLSQAMALDRLCSDVKNAMYAAHVRLDADEKLAQAQRGSPDGVPIEVPI